MNLDDVTRRQTEVILRVAEIEANGDPDNPVARDYDPEKAHSLEDALHLDVLKWIASGEFSKEVCMGFASAVLVTDEFEFSRWYA